MDINRGYTTTHLDSKTEPRVASMLASSMCALRTLGVSRISGLSAPLIPEVQLLSLVLAMQSASASEQVQLVPLLIHDDGMVLL